MQLNHPIYSKFKFVPAKMIVGASGGYSGYSMGQEFAAYQWFCRRLREYIAKHSPGNSYKWGFLNATISINNGQPDVLRSLEAPSQRLAHLFLRLDEKEKRDRVNRTSFLRFCGIESWADLNKPMVLAQANTRAFPDFDWFKMQGREFHKSPNEFHSGATSVFSAGVYFNHLNGWTFTITYGYPHDGSSWHYEIQQNPKHSLKQFVQAVNDKLDKVLKPDPQPSTRIYRESMWHQKHDALRGLFYDREYRLGGWEDKLADQLVGVEGPSLAVGRMDITASRLRTLNRWLKADTKAANARAAKEKAQEEERKRKKGW